VSIRLIVDGAVYMIAAREAMILVRRLRARVSRVDDLDDALAAALVLEWALETERPHAVSFTAHEAEAVVRVAPDPGRIPYSALRRQLRP
jgi:hypothetical protein